MPIIAINENVVPVGLMCTPCHTPGAAHLDFAELGYSRQRVRELQSTVIVRQVLRIEQGQPFYLPGFVEPRSSGQRPTTTRPSQPPEDP